MHVSGAPVAPAPPLLLLPLEVPLLPELAPLELWWPNIKPPSPSAASLPPTPESRLKVDEFGPL
jgi:hypothetical protein